MAGLHGFILIEAEDGELILIFDKLDHIPFENYVAILSAPHNKVACEFLILVLEGVRLILYQNNRSFEKVEKIESYLNAKLNS